MIKVPNITAVSDLESADKRIYNRIHLILEEDVDLSAGEPEVIVSDEARTMGALKLKAMGGGFDVLNEKQKAFIKSH